MQCNTCGQLFNSVCRFYLHRRQHRKLACRNCDEIFTSKANLVKHEKKRKEFTCHHCDGKFCNNDHLQKHLRSIGEKEQPPRSRENTLKWINQLDEPVYFKIIYILGSLHMSWETVPMIHHSTTEKVLPHIKIGLWLNKVH